MSATSIPSSTHSLPRTVASSLPMNEHLARLTEKVKIAVSSRWIIWGKAELKNQLNTLAPDHLRSLIEALVLKPTDQAELLKTVECLIDLLSLEKLESVVQSSFPEHRNALESARGMCEDAKQYLQQTQKVSPSVILTFLSSIGNSLLIALEGILTAFGIAELFLPAEDETHAQYRGYRLMALSQLFTLLTACLVPILGPDLKEYVIKVEQLVFFLR